jgi:hypothetical protein
MAPKAKKWFALTALVAALISIDVSAVLLVAPKVRAAATGNGKVATMVRAGERAVAATLSSGLSDLSRAVMGSTARALFHGTRRSTEAYALVVRATPALEGRRLEVCGERVTMSSGASGCMARSAARTFVIECPETDKGPYHLEKMVDGPMPPASMCAERAGAGPPSRAPETGFARLIPQVMIY